MRSEPHISKTLNKSWKTDTWPDGMLFATYSQSAELSSLSSFLYFTLILFFPFSIWITHCSPSMDRFPLEVACYKTTEPETKWLTKQRLFLFILNSVLMWLIFSVESAKNGWTSSHSPQYQTIIRSPSLFLTPLSCHQSELGLSQYSNHTQEHWRPQCSAQVGSPCCRFVHKCALKGFS